MHERGGSEDALRHVRFAGRPISAARPPRRPPRLSSPAASVAAPTSELPGPFVSWVLHRAGLDAASYRGQPLERRVSACLRALRAHSEAEARQILEDRVDLLATAVDALLIGVTEFFRDGAVFEALGTEVLAKRASRGRPLRVWSAGCSTGAELYSVAILLSEAGLLKGSFLLGSDCRHDAIERAKAALYNADDLRKVDPSDRPRHFEKAGSLWRPAEPLRRHVHWKVADLDRHVEPGPWDMILWRNMAIYLRAGAAASVWRRLESALAPGGVVVVGKAERPPAELRLICVRRCIYRAWSRDDGHDSVPAVRRTVHRNSKASETSV